MTNEQYAKRLSQLYDKVLKLRSDKDYIVNQAQMDKFVELVEFFSDETKYGGGKIDDIDITPKEEHGGLTASFIVFDVFGDRIQDMCKVLAYTSAISIDATKDCRVCISMTVPNVFVKK